MWNVKVSFLLENSFDEQLFCVVKKREESLIVKSKIQAKIFRPCAFLSVIFREILCELPIGEMDKYVYVRKIKKCIIITS